MKKLLLTFAGMLALANFAQAAVTIEIDAGVLSTSTGVPLTNGTLLELVASRSASTVFTAPTAASFTGGSTDNVVVAKFAFNQGTAGYVTGETDSLISYTLENTLGASTPLTFDAGDTLLLRWFPGLTTASATPNANSTYGEYRSGTAADGGLNWTSPADGGTYSVPNGLNFLTTTAGGGNSDMVGRASLTVVPEPSTFALVGFVVTGLVGLRLRSNRAVA